MSRDAPPPSAGAGSKPSGQRRDLGASLAWLAKALMDAEEPVLQGRGLTMWDYAVLSSLESGPAPRQSGLATDIGRDQTRLIPILDGLEARDLLRRTRDPADRRNRIVALTPLGQELLASCRVAVRQVEQQLMSVLEPHVRDVFIAALDQMVDAVRADSRQEGGRKR